jgi:hypothetical protein
MSLLLNLLMYAAVGGSEWYLALRRTLACARGERALMISIVFLENILGLWVLSNFVRDNDWLVAISYSLGGAMGAFLVNFKQKQPAAAGGGETARHTIRGDAEPLPAQASAANA